MRTHCNPSFFVKLFVAALLSAAMLPANCFAQLGFGNNGGVTVKYVSQPYFTGKTTVTSLDSKNNTVTNSVPLVNGTTVPNLQYPAPNTPQNGGPTPDPNNATVIQNVITLTLIDDQGYVIPTGFKATVNITVQITSLNGTSTQLSNQNLIVTYDPTSGKTYSNKNYLTFSQGATVSITVNTVSCTVNTTAITTLPGSNLPVQTVLKLENDFNITSYFQLSATAKPTVTLQTEINPLNNTPDELPLIWQWPLNTGNNYTQLEWTWLEDELINSYPNSGGIVTNTALLFANNATRVDLPEGLNNDAFSIPLLYDGVGHLYFRMRAVNVLPGGGLTTGPWYTTGDAASTGMPAPVAFNGHNNNLNWQVTTSFAEDGKRKSVIQYYDGSLRGRQTVTKDNTTKTVVTAESFYDLQGRPTIQILPAPGIDNIIAYRQNLNLFNAQAPGIDPANYFDLIPATTPDLRLQTTTPTGSQAGGASQYYSSSNAGLGTTANSAWNIPDAGGYPYTQTVYTPDATGRIAAQGGVGPGFQIGSGHETQYFYGTPLQEELDGLFGTEVGYHQHYFKNMVMDANGQVSVSYVDMHGRTIATALAGASQSNGKMPNGMAAINNNNTADYPNQQANTITSDLLANGSNVIKDNTIESENTILVSNSSTPSSGTVYTFNYQLPAAAFQPAGCNATTLNYPYTYDLEITMINEATGQPVLLSDNTTFDKIYKGITSASPTITLKTAPLTVGSYTVKKTLTLRTDIMQNYLQQYLTVGQGICTSLAAIITADSTAAVTATGCAMPNYVPATNFCLVLSKETQATYVNNYLANLGLTTTTATTQQVNTANAAYTAALAHCQSLSTTVSQRLANIQTDMLADMTPYSGQYASNPGDGGVFSPVTGSIYTYTGTGANMFNTYNIFKNSKYTAVQSVYTTPDAFTQGFQPAWAQSLLQYHPESARLTFAQNNLVSAYNWMDGSFSQVSTWSAAAALGFTASATAVTNSDVFLQAASASSYKTKMQGYLNTAWQTSNGQGLTMWQIAYGNVMCTNSTGVQACYVAAPPNPASMGSLTVTQANSVWGQFQGLYQSAWEAQVNDYVNTNSPLPNDENLIAQGFILHFPKGNDQIIEQTGQSSTSTVHSANQWYTPNPGNNSSLMPVSSVTQAESGQNSTNVAAGYVQIWRNQLLQNIDFNNPAKVPPANLDTVLNLIITGLVTADGINTFNSTPAGLMGIVQNSIDAMHPYGASNIPTGGFNGHNPITDVDGTLSYSFEDVFTKAITYLNAHWGTSLVANSNCSPYVINFPRPYGNSPVVSTQQISVVDNCTCSQYASIVAAAEAANPAINSSGTVDTALLNVYLNSTYGQTISQALFAGLRLCPNSLPTFTLATGGTYSGFTLATPQPLPQYLTCGFTAAQQCLTCSAINTLAAAFSAVYPPPSPNYKTLPLVPNSGTTLSQQEINYNILFANYLNYKTGFSYTWADYQQHMYTAGCTAYYCPTGGIADTVKLSTNTTSLTQAQNVVVAFATVYLNPGFSFAASGTDSFTASINSAASACRTGGGQSMALVSLALGAPAGVICPNTSTTQVLTNPTSIVYPQNPCQQTYDKAAAQATHDYQVLYYQLLANFNTSYATKALANAVAKEAFTMQYQTAEYHYTLYYYDMAGNLVKTVPPKGVYPNYATAYITSVEAAKWTLVTTGSLPATPPANPTHTLTTNYRYNSLNQVVAQNTPDAGTSQFWYDALGRLVVSQNAQQFADAATHSGVGNYSYTLYDVLGRITEVGQKPQSTQITQAITQNNGLATVTSPQSLANWLASNGSSYPVYNKVQITRTMYDVGYTPISGDVTATTFSGYINQQNLRNRVSYSEVFNTDPGAGGNALYHASATYYTYDIHGNVNVLLQDYGNSTGTPNIMNQSTGGNRFKATQYNYDLISGKVNQVAYQPGKADAFYHQYYYDAENRITQVKTSRDNIYYENDAAYSYYKHGPLSQTTIGQLQVQQLNYSYTLQGWLKSVNAGWAGSNTIPPAGNPATAVFGYSLHYFAGDYTAIHATTATISAMLLQPATGYATPLYNGNIAAMAVSINVPGLAPGTSNINNPMAYAYGYDQLNRIVGMNAYTGTAGTLATLTPVQDYAEQVTYDPNGNITSYNRNGYSSPAGTGAQIDNLSYKYEYATQTINGVATSVAISNKLRSITDGTGAPHTGMGDVGTQSTNNYAYDAIGNLKGNAADGIGTATAGASNSDGITWTVYGKISSITKVTVGTTTVTSTIGYTYDVAGNRISKTVTPYSGGTANTAAAVTTWYVRDASGNVMGIYTGGGGSTAVNSGDVTLAEIPLYGSSRLGELKPSTDVQNITATTVTLSNGTVVTTSSFTRGQKVYELSNHLGNVLATVSDRKAGVDANGNGIVDATEAYNADVVSAQDYYPFGMLEPGRQYNAGSQYRYAFNGKEQDGDIDGTGVDYDYGARIYDARIGKFLSIDPLTPRYPELTPYQFAGNSPIANIDLDGLEPYPSIRNLDKTKSVLEHAMDESFWTRNNMLLGAAMGSLNTKPHVWWQHAHGFANNAGNRIFNNMKGVAGEAIAANAIYNTFAEHVETIQPNGTFNPTNDPDGGFDGIPGGTWDFFLNIRFVKPRPNIFTGEEPNPKAFEIVTNSNDGSSRSSTFDLSSPKNFLFEIKTNNAAAPPSLLYLNIRKGFQQAITNAKVNSKAYSILVVDQQAYQAMWNGITPLQRESITNLYNELKDLNKKNGGDGVLWLISNLEQNAKNLATKAYHEIKQNTTTETQDTSK